MCIVVTRQYTGKCVPRCCGCKVGWFVLSLQGFQVQHPTISTEVDHKTPTVYLSRNILHSCVIAEQGSLSGLWGLGRK